MIRRISSVSEAIVSNVLKHSGGLADADVFLRWADIVGQDVAAMATPIKIRVDPIGARSLYLSVAAHDTITITYNRPIILEKLNTFFGKGSFSSIKIIGKI